MRRIIILINTLGLIGYLFWLVYSRQRIFYTQGGIVYLLPCLPFFFVYFYLGRTTHDDEP